MYECVYVRYMYECVYVCMSCHYNMLSSYMSNAAPLGTDAGDMCLFLEHVERYILYIMYYILYIIYNI